MSDQNMIDEHELLELFARRRPDPDRIAQGIAQRLAEDESGTGASGREPATLSRAAAWLPLPLPLQGSKLWIWLSMPMLLLAATWIALIGAGSNIRKSMQGRQERQPDIKHVSRIAAQKPKWCAGFALIAGAVVLPMLGWSNAFDAVLLTAVVSMFSLAHLVKKNVALGYGDRQQMAAICVGLLDTLLFLTLIYHLYDIRGAGTGQWTFASPLALAIGTLAFVRYVPGQSILAIATAGYFLFLSQFSLFRPTHEQPATLEQVRAFAAAPDLERNDHRLREYRSIVLSLRAAEQAPAVPSDLWQTVLKPIAADLPLDSFALSECARADLLPEQQWRRIAATPYRTREVEQLLQRTGPVRLKPYDEYQFRLVMARDPSEQQLAALAERLMASWPSNSETTPLTRCRLVAAGLDAIGRSDLADSQRQLVHAALVRTQQRSGMSSGGFSESHGFLRPTCNDIAMALMMRFGVPAGLDLHALRTHLENNSLVPRSKMALLRDRAYASYAHLLQLDAQIGTLPDRTFLRVLVDERMLWAMIAMVLLCIYTVRITPVRAVATERELVGAMP